ncbi:hypothetical protein ACFL6U_28480 [Planctomycetota bacterium]
MDALKEILNRIPDNLFLALVVFLLALLAIALWIAIKQGRELTLWPPKLGPRPQPNEGNNTAQADFEQEKVSEPLLIVSYGSVNWVQVLENATHTFKASGFALVKIVELNSRRLYKKIKNSSHFTTEIYLGDPFSPAAAMRVKDEDDNYLAPQIIARVAIQVNDTQEKLKPEGKDSKLLLKHFSCYPTMATVIADTDLYVYFYPFGKLGTDSPVMIFRDFEKHALAEFFIEHFETLAASSYEIPREKTESLIHTPS